MQDADLATLQSQLANLRVEHAGLNAQWDGLKTQLDNMLRNNPARPGVQQQWADVGVRKARVEGEIAALEARIALKQGRPTGVPSASTPSPWNNPGLVVPAFSFVSLILLLPLMVGWGRRIARRSPTTTPIASDVVLRLERMENAIETVAIEVERISEGQRFVTKILAEPAAKDPTPAQAKPPLALGAGEAPLERIVVPERDAARKGTS